MRSRIIIPFVFVVLILLGWTETHYGKQEAVSSVSAFADAPDFSWHAFDGTMHTLSELSGHTVVLHFWASWCTPCREEFPKLLTVAQSMPDIIFLTVSSDEDHSRAERFIVQMQRASQTRNLPNVLYAFDPKKTLTLDVFQTVQYPESIMLDAAHHLRRKFSGPVDWSKNDIKNYLRQLSNSQ